MESSDATNKADEVEATLALLGVDEASIGYVTMSVHVMAETEEAALAKARMAQEVMDGLGFVTEVERVNAFQSWLGSLPGHPYGDVRRPLMNSLNVCDVIPPRAGLAWGRLERPPRRAVSLAGEDGGQHAVRPEPASGGRGTLPDRRGRPGRARARC